MKMAIIFQHNFPTWKTMMMGAFACLSLSGCRDQNFDFEQAKNQNFEYEYRNNFEKLFGKIDPNQSWDFSKGYGTRANTRASFTHTTPTENAWYEVENGTLTWMIENLQEGENNRSMGNPFVLTAVSEEPFYIIPIYQGQAGCNWDFYLTVNGESEQVWTKSQGIKQQGWAPGSLENTTNLTQENIVSAVGHDGPEIIESTALATFKTAARSSNAWDQWVEIKTDIDLTNDKFYKVTFDLERTAGSGDAYIEIERLRSGGAGKVMSTFSGSETMELDILDFTGKLEVRLNVGSNNADDQFKISEITVEEYGLVADGNYVEFKNNDNLDQSSNANTLNASQVSGEKIEINGLTRGDILSFYLQITGDGKWNDGGTLRCYCPEGETKSSLNQMMVALECPEPTNLPEGYKAMIIGCEDNDLQSDIDSPINQGYTQTASDWDMNDVVFLLIGKELPIVGRYESKRYMVEDLGSTYDIDFNDIVFDIERIIPQEANSEGQFEDNNEEETQFVTVRAMGGKLNFELFVNNKSVFIKQDVIPYGQMYNTLGQIQYTDYIATFPCSGWDPEANNVSFKVLKGNKTSFDAIESGDVSEEDDDVVVKFPERGATPYIIAFPTTKNWRDERHKICRHWVYDEIKEAEVCTHGCETDAADSDEEEGD